MLSCCMRDGDFLKCVGVIEASRVWLKRNVVEGKVKRTSTALLAPPSLIIALMPALCLKPIVTTAALAAGTPYTSCAPFPPAPAL
jgi:hypothetical protein